MDGRLLGIPAAAALAVGVPIVIGQTGSEPGRPALTLTISQPPQPEPEAAALKVRLVGDTGGPHPAFIGLRAAGDPPPAKKKFVLVDETGAYSATVEKARQPGSCPTPPRRTGVGNEVWCLVANSVEAGHELAGTINGAGTKLALTIDRKNKFFWGWPLLVLLAGLFIAALVTLWPPRLKALVQRLKLERLIARAPITGLNEWVKEQRAQGVSDEALLKTVAPVVLEGPRSTKKARDDLKHQLVQATDIPDIPYKREAEKEAARKDYRVSDFFQKDGKPRPSHPAAEYSLGIKKIDAYVRDLDRLRHDVITHLIQDCQKEPLSRVREAEVALAVIKTNEDLKELDLRWAAATAAYVAAMSRTECLAMQDAAGIEEELAFARGTWWYYSAALDEPALFDFHEVALGALTLFAGLLTAATCLFVLAFAGVTVYEAVYAPNNTFATFADYFKLFSAALASGAAASVLALLGYWRLPKSTPVPSESSAPTAS